MLNKCFMAALLLGLPVLYSVKYHTPNDEEVIPTAESNWAEKTLEGMSLEQKIGQFFMMGAYPNKGDKHMQEIINTVTTHQIGGIIWFPVNKANYQKYAAQVQKASSQIPLFYALDAEWGVNMRMEGEDRFPYAYTIGAANDLQLSHRIAEMMGYECAELGFQFNFSPVADVNSNPDNPVIGFRSFGQDPHKVGKQVATFVKGFEASGVYSSIKHFPGHGDTDKDSHHELPVISKTMEQLEANDWIPFREGIKAGATSVMVGHLKVPALDKENPSSLSKVIIHDYLKGKLGFKGLVISDALNMKAVSEKYGKVEVAVKAFEAGCDILIYSENIGEAIQLIKKKVEKNEISMKEINDRCLKILRAKQKSFIEPVKGKNYTEGEKTWAKYNLYEKSTALIRNEQNLLPLSDLSKKTLHISIGTKPDEFISMTDEFMPLNHQHISIEELKAGNYKIPDDSYENLIISFHASTVLAKNNFGVPTELTQFIDKIDTKKNATFIYFGNPLGLNPLGKMANFDAIVIAYENNSYVQNRVAQQIFGAIPFSGKLPSMIGHTFPINSGIETKWNGRLKFSQPEELGIDPKFIVQIDSLVQKGIADKAFPGCQIVGAVDGKIFFRKTYGSHRYNDEIVHLDDLYDLASITKVAASTTALMKLQTEEQFSLSTKLMDYLPAETSHYPLGKITLKEILAHQAGLKSWIPFYKSTMTGTQLSENLYRNTAKTGYVEVAKNIYLQDSYGDTIRKAILMSTLGTKKYLYSDLGYYFVKQIIEQQSGQAMDEYLRDNVYAKMGLYKMMYNPHLTVNLKQIVPTEDDKIYRHQLVHGYVHDPGAAMIGGVGGHAGLFSNATQLAALNQMYLNNGFYGGLQIIHPKVIEEYTRVQFSGNRRGAGFDKPVLGSGGGTCDESASQQSYGHSGFTGTIFWADPKNGLNYVFLSNRVYPDAENKKIISSSIRTKIQRVLNDAIKAKS